MTPAEIRDEILDILSEIAPDEDLSNLEDSKSFREQMELDSMDFLDIVMELRNAGPGEVDLSDGDEAGAVD
jgi:acyl carrier protein